MRFSTILSLALPLLVAAESSSSATTTTTYTSTETQTKTITISQVVASVTSTYSVPHNGSVGTTSYYTSIPYPATTLAGTTTRSGPAPTKRPSDVPNAASSVKVYAGSAGMMAMIAAALL